MDNSQTNNNPQTPETQPQNKPIRKPRKIPTVEGINAPRGAVKEPVIKISLTSQEEDLISETGSAKSAVVIRQSNSQKILPQSLIDRMEKKPTHYKAIFSVFIILLALVGGAYEFYIQDVQRHIPPVEVGALNLPPDASTTADGTDGQDASGSLASLLNASTTPGSASSTTATTTPIASPTPTPQPQLTINNTPTGYLNVRSQPTTAASVITQVHPGESYGYSQTQNGWYQITLTNGTTGWVSGQYITPQ